MDGEFDVVTGAYGFTGRFLAGCLLARSRPVITLTGHPRRPHPFGARVPARPFHFDAPRPLRASLAGAGTLYNTYWIRLEHGEDTFARALEHTRQLVEAARAAGVGHFVHFSCAAADPESDLDAFRAQGQAEELVRAGFPGATIVRPTLIFGPGSTVFNNLAWLLRKVPVFAVADGGRAPVQPIHVEDVCRAAVAAAVHRRGGRLVLGGPETLPFRDLVRLLARATGGRARLLPVKLERLMHLTERLETWVGEVLVTRDELLALNRGLLVAPQTPSEAIPLARWLAEEGDRLGRNFESYLDRYHRFAEETAWPHQNSNA